MNNLDLPRITRNRSGGGQRPGLQGAPRMILQQGRNPTPKSRPRNAWFVNWESAFGKPPADKQSCDAVCIMQRVYAEEEICQRYLQIIL